jgi:hypothetical protein
MRSGVKMAASKHVTKLNVNGVQCLEIWPRDHTFTSGHTPNKYNIIEPIDTNFNMELKTILQWKTNTNHAWGYEALLKVHISPN